MGRSGATPPASPVSSLSLSDLQRPSGRVAARGGRCGLRLRRLGTADAAAGKRKEEGTMTDKRWWLASVQLAATVAALSVRAAESAVEPPSLRHVNVLAIQAQRGAEVRCETACVQHGFRAYQDSLRCRLVKPDGFVAASARVRPGDSGHIGFASTWEGVCALEVSSGWNLARIGVPTAIPHAYRSGVGKPLKTVKDWGPLYFHVPQGTRYFNIWVQASVTGEGLHLAVADPAGGVVHEEDGDVDKRTKIQLRVKPEQADGPWSIRLSSPRAPGMVLDDVHLELGRHLPPFLTPVAAWARLFAGDWRHDPDASGPPSRFADTTPAVAPFKGLAGPALDRAYARDAKDGWRSALPFTYVLDYGSKHLGNPEYVPTVATAPPVLLHLGKDVPFNHGWGPVQALGGENQAYGKGEHIRRISPDEVARRIAGLREMVDELHRSGVRWVTPYICAMTVNGDAERRTGFWEFYDHWSEYRGVGLGPRPASDPLNWLQHDADGSLRRYYGYKDGYYPPFETNHRYSACWRAQGWRTWLSEVVRFAGTCGFDGVFVDNGTSLRCQCPRCLAAFREHLARRYTVEDARRRFGTDVLAETAFPGKDDVALTAELNRFWCEAVRDQMAVLKQVGSRELGREFIVFPNGGRPSFIQRGLIDSDFVMFEKSHGDYGTHPGLVFSPLFEGVTLRAYNANVFEHKFVQCLRGRVRPIILSRPGYPRRLPWLMLNPNAARLGLAECGAFSGGGGFLFRPSFGVYHDVLNEYRRFFETHPDLYAGLDTHAATAVLAFAEQSWLGNPEHMAAVHALTDVLTASHVLFDYVSESRFEPDVLSRYGTVIVPAVRVVSDEQLRVLEQYVRGGGHAVVVGELAALDDGLRPREQAAGLQAAVRGLARGEHASLGGGRVTLLGDSDDVPAALGAGRQVLVCADREQGRHVKVNAFREASVHPGRLVLHVVNYSVPLGVEAKPPEEVDGLRLRLPLPEGAGVASVTAYSPDREGGLPLRPDGEGGPNEVVLPRLRIYEVVEVRLTW